MAKNKKTAKKKGLSETTRKDTVKKKVLNPFEVHVNRQKSNVIGRSSKTDRGLPGIARAKALKKRKSTLLQEYRGKDKANKFFDHRIGERNTAMTAEDKIMARFAAEKMRMHRKKSIFNLADDEILTHRGQTLSEIEKFDDPRTSDEEDEPGKLDANFVEDAHFGGGVLKKADENKRTRKDLIEELIAESKKRKAEKQRNREQTIELTEKLDSEWKDLLPIVTTVKTGAALVNNEEISKPDSYDTVMKQLIFEARGKPSDRLKSEDELAKEEKECLEKLEAERLQRMHGLNPSEKGTLTSANSRLRSADDLDDGFDFESGEDTMLTYTADGQLQLQGDEGVAEKTDNGNGCNDDSQSSADDDCGGGSDAGGGGGGGGDGDGDDDDDDDDEEANMDDDERVASDSSEEDNLPDLKEDSESDDDSSAKGNEKKNSEKKSSSQQPNHTSAQKSTVKQNINNIKDILMERKKLMEKAREELPYTFKVPDSYDDLQNTLSHWGLDHQTVIIERMLKCNHPSLAEGNREKLQELLKFLLQHINDSAIPDEDQQSPQCFSVLDRLIPHIYDLTHMSPVSAGQSVLEVIKEKQTDFRNSKRTYPGCDTLVFLKLVSHLFPTSDFRHPVVTPTIIFMEQILWESRIQSRRDVATGLFITTLLLEYSVLSKRFSPAAVNFLCGVLYLSVDKSAYKSVRPVPPFKSKGEASGLLILSEDFKTEDFVTNHKMNLSDLLEDAAVDDNFKIRALWTSVKLLSAFQQNLEPLASSFEIFKPVSVLINHLNTEQFPPDLKDDISNLHDKIEKMSVKKICHLIFEKKKPKALRLYEPKVEQVFDCKRRRPMGPEKQEREKLLHKYRRELKGAVREIRRDRAFLTKVKLKQTLKSDLERKEKVKEIFGSAAMQQGELNLLKRKKEAGRRH
ncbi:nucleolar protein 14 homolog [Schistocerca cancellata]|uniref:nucleolar protein 14 homolog n=1 Tax=Schistocerca cancellata TaxID=274614 RepID=UPI0021184FC2|nr:nucleolar protein 14 homolog [Schistocerca cancellata]